MNLDLAITRPSATPVYRQIARQIQEMISAGTLPPGFRLPPERSLAEQLGVNRSTVLAAYRELKERELVSAHVGRGTQVLPRASGTGSTSPQGLPWHQLWRELGPRAHDPLLRDLLALSERRDVISLSIGLPAPEMLPAELVREVMDRLLREEGAAALTHCPTEGHTPLRESLSELVEGRGIHCSPDDVAVLSGSQQGLDLAMRVLVDPGDVVVVEEPSFFGALQAFRAAGARLVGVPVDHEGMRVDLLAPLLERVRPKLIYTLPTFQNPSGAVLSLERRHRLLELACRFQVPLLEDDPYFDLRLDGEPIPPLKALDPAGCVLYLSTFSKVLFPGFRLGFLVAPRPVLRRFVLAKQILDLHSNTPGQWVLDRLLRDGCYHAHVRSLRPAYRTRRDALAAALAPARAEGLMLSVPEGGFYLWGRLPDDVSPTRLLAHAAAAGISYLPGSACFVDEGPGEFIRLNFSFCDPAGLREGAARLFRAFSAARSSGAEADPIAPGTRPLV